MRHIILDTDMGIDDALALFLMYLLVKLNFERGSSRYFRQIGKETL